MAQAGKASRTFMAVFLAFSLAWAGLFCASVSTAVAATPSVPIIPAKLTAENVSLVPYLEFFVDEAGTLSVQDIQAPEIQKQFKPYSQENITQDFGVLWLRFTVGASSGATDSAHTYLLDMGSALTHNTQLFMGQKTASSSVSPLSAPYSITWQEYSPSASGIFLMPESQAESITGYVRLKGLPGLWFAPTLRTPHNAATSWELLAQPAAVVALFIVMLLCLLRGITGKGQWRYWAGLYTGVALFYAMMGIPVSATGHVAMADLAAILAPGVALILLPHVARHIMNTPQFSRAIDLQYRALTVVGVVVALLPLVPGFTFTMRYLELWPLLTLCFVPTTLAAWMSGYEGARRLLAACLLPPFAVALALLGLLEPVGFGMVPAGALAAIPLWGVALGSLILAGSATPSHLLEEDRYDVDASIPTVESLVQNDPNLRLVPVEEAQSLETEHDAEDEDAPKKVISPLEEQLRWPVEQLSRDVASLEACALPVAARENIASLTSVAREISNILHAPAKERMSAPSMGGIEEHIFDLQSLLRQAHDYVSPVADKKNVALSWFMPPHLAQCYKGDAMQLLFVLRLLLESAVRSTHRGAVQLAVRRVPESVNPGHLLFTVTDTGTGKPPQDRSVTALARAWELSASYHGFLGVECNAYGASISFTVNYEVSSAADREAAGHVQGSAKKRPIILLSDNTEERHMWGFFLEKIAHPVAEARNADEALDIYKNHSAALIILDARMPMQQMEQVMRSLRQQTQETGEKAPECMAIYAQDVTVIQAEALFDDMGFAHLMALPVTRQSLYTQVEEILAQQMDADLRAEDNEGATSDEAMQEDPQCVRLDMTEDLFADAMPDAMPDEMQNQKAEETQESDEAQELDENDEEIIDTGMPILDLHAPAHMPSTPPASSSLSSGGASLSDGILLLDMQDEQHNEQVSQPRADENHDMSEEEARRIDDVLQSAEAPFMAEAQASGHPMQPMHSDSSPSAGSRPAPTEDKSNAAYLTSLLDLGLDDPAISVVPPQSQHDTEQESAVAPEAMPVDGGLNAKNEEELLQSINDLINTMEAPMAPMAPMEEEQSAPVQKPDEKLGDELGQELGQEQVQEADTTSNMVPTRPVMRMRPKSMRKPKGKVPFERRAVSSIGGGGDWVGEPMPIPSTSKAEMPAEESVAKVLHKAAPPSTPKPAVKSLAEDLVEVLAEAKQEITTQLAKDTSMMQNHEFNSTAPMTSSLDYLDEESWVGEPMPIATKVQDHAHSPVALHDDPLSMTPLGATAAQTLPELTFHRDEDGERRGREELGYLKKYLNKFQRKPEKSTSDPTLAQNISSQEWVGEAMPVPKINLAEDAVKTTPKASEVTPEAMPVMPQAASQNPMVKRALDDQAIHEAAPSLFERAMPSTKLEPQEPQEPQASAHAPHAEEALEEILDELMADMDAEKQPQEQGVMAEESLLDAFSSSAKTGMASATPTAQDLPDLAEAGAVPDVPDAQDAQDSESAAAPQAPQVPLSPLSPLSPIDQLLQDLDRQLAETKEHLAAHRLRGVESAAAAMAGSAEDFGLRTLGRLARTVEAAAKAEDKEALMDLLPELDMSVQRNRAALQG